MMKASHSGEQAIPAVMERSSHLVSPAQVLGRIERTQIKNRLALQPASSTFYSKENLSLTLLKMTAAHMGRNRDPFGIFSKRACMDRSAEEGCRYDKARVYNAGSCKTVGRRSRPFLSYGRQHFELYGQKDPRLAASRFETNNFGRVKGSEYLI